MWNLKLGTGVAIIILNILCPSALQSQGVAHVPTLLMVGSPESAGMGETEASAPSFDILSALQNPANSVVFNSPLAIQFGHSETVPDLILSDGITSRSTFNALAATFPIKQPFGLHRNFQVTIGTLENATSLAYPFRTQFSVDTADYFNFDRHYILGFGWEAGYTFRLSLSVTDLQNTITVRSQTDWNRVYGTGTVFAYGLLLDVPASNLVKWTSAFDRNTLQPMATIHVGTSHNAIGTILNFYPYGYDEPPPSTAHLNFGIEYGLGNLDSDPAWRLFNFRWSIDASDLLGPQGEQIDTVGYDAKNDAWITEQHEETFIRSGYGRIHPLKNILLGTITDDIGLRKGWEISCGNFLFIRGGRIDDPDLRVHCNTSGYSMHLEGLLRTLSALSSEESPYSPLFQILSSHFDLSYAYARYSGQGWNSGTNTEIPDREISGWTFSIHN